MPKKTFTSDLWDESSPVLSSFLMSNLAKDILRDEHLTLVSARNVFTFLALVRIGIDTNIKMFRAIPWFWSGSKQPYDLGNVCIDMGLVRKVGRQWELTMLGKLRILELEDSV